MLLYAIILFVTAAIFLGLSLSIYKGNIHLIHDYHQKNVTDKAAYGKAFGKAMLVIPVTMLLSGSLALWDPAAQSALWVLVAGLILGIGCIIAVQRKYNKGIF